MLQKIRNKSGSVVIKIILAIIGASFVVFGIADVVRIMMATPPIAKVGGAKITFQDFYTRYHNTINELSRQHRGAVPPQLLEKLPMTVAEAMVKEAATDSEMERIGIVASKSLVANAIKAIPQFCSDGKFDPALYQNQLRAYGMTPRAFINNMSKQLRLQQMFAPMVDGAHISETYLNILVNTMVENKVFDIAFIPENCVEVPTPSEKKLKKYLEKNKEQYTVQEERVIEICILRYDDIKKTIPVSDEEIAAETAERRETSVAQEKRTVHRFICKTESSGEAVKQILLKRVSVNEALKQNPDAKLETIGSIGRGVLPKSVEDSVFSLGENESFGPILMNGSYVVYVVSEITSEAVQQSNNKVSADELRADIQGRKLPVLLDEMKNQMEDALAEGKSFAELKQNFPVEVLSDVPANPNSDSLKTFGSDITAAIIAAASSLEEGADSTLDFDGMSVMIRLAKVIPQHVPPFDDIAEKVTADWAKSTKQRLEIEWCSNNFTEALRDSKMWDDTVKKTKCTSQTLSVSAVDLIGGKVSQNLFSSNDLNGLMLLKKNQIEFKVAIDGRVVAVRVNRVERNAASVLREGNAAQESNIREKVSSGFTSEIATLAEQSIRNLYNVKIREDSINKVRALGHDE
ncbi:MAG: peptidylprolyl isomerase [Holosporales bacterium]|jgi:peptidyl-prolyl cis-trans isomerase D|nr:peptidylprolyl isomerase [Holosporales bacterium]